MQYHIQTTPIWDAFREKDGCPLCRLFGTVESGLLQLYSGEAVMSPEYRVDVNKTGFCETHLNKLLEGENKLGLGLQLSTRVQYLIDCLDTPDSVKAAAKLAAELQSQKDNCVVCREAKHVMARYAYTVAEMFLHEREFPPVLSDAEGFCLSHFSLLLRYASHAKNRASEYVATLKRVQQQRMRNVKKDLESFTGQYDYRASKPSPSVKNALVNAFVLLQSNLPKNRNK